jgi:hypothetical protein
MVGITYAVQVSMDVCSLIGRQYQVAADGNDFLAERSRLRPQQNLLIQWSGEVSNDIFRDIHEVAD